ncbi:HAMP domain-containing protein [Clostridium sp. MCC353]|uniref:cache domain-containing sensor histidine kinase n=1 Tax=Clostridium sp. MCC353 TaxID=2592646 RepID=UPI001C029D16|nr:sensor histidine kinase [Clostridium sp. MCC353]MBT9775335.1 HAMP domain-containing protein [Clostridium sp. MCC353]
MSIRVRLAIAFSFFIIAPLMVLMAYSNKISSEVLLDQISDAQVHTVESYSRTVNDMLMDMNRLLLNMSSDNDVRRLMSGEAEKKDGGDMLFKYQQLQMFDDILEGAQMFLMKYPFAVMIIPNEGQSFGSRENIGAYAESLKASSWFPEVMASRDSTILWLDPLKTGDSIKENRFCAVIPVKESMTSQKNIGIIYIELSEKYIYDMMTRSASHSELYLVDNDGHIVSGGDKNAIGREFPLLSFEKAADSSGWKKVGYEGREMMVVYSSPMVEEWRAVSVTPYETIFSRVNAVHNRTYIITLVLLGIFVAVALGIAQLISRPVMSLSEKMNQVEEGNLGIRVPETGQGEIRVLQTSFNRMLDRINDLMKQLKIRENQKREAEIDALQAQINPHFLFNVLSSIRWAAAAKDPGVEEMVLQLSALLKMSIKKGQEQITLLESCQMLEKYVSLHNLRHQNKVELRIFIEEGMGYHLLPRLLLQPLVENSIIHGMGNMESGHITIRGEEKDGFLNIRVEDDGVGFPEGFDPELRQMDKKRNKASFSSIGLINVRDRVNLYYEGNSHFRLYNRMEDGECRGAVVEISICLEAIERYEREQDE